MDFFKPKIRMVAAVASLLIIAAIIWMILSGGSGGTSFEGTLVDNAKEEVVL